MLDIKLIREQPEMVRERLASRGAGDESKLSELLAIDEQRRKSLAAVEQLKGQRNRFSKEIGALMGQKKTTEAEARKSEVRTIGERISELDSQVAETETAREHLLMRLPNLPHANVAVGKTSEDNPLVRSWGEKAKFDFTPKSHIELCESLRLVDFARGTKLSGSGFLLYTN